MIVERFRDPQFRRDSILETSGAVIRWWEGRRFFFNFVVGCTGVVTCVLLIVCTFTAESFVGEPIGKPDGPLLGLFGIIFYGVLANVFYTAGWLSELLVRATTSEKSFAFGLKAFRTGVYFSILLTLSPAVVCWLALAVALMHGQRHGPIGE